MLALLCTAPAAVAAAHPFGADVDSHRLVLTADPEGLTVLYSAEIPIQEIMRSFNARYAGRADVGEREDAEFMSELLGELASNLTIFVDGQPVGASWEPPPDVPNGVAGERFFVYHLRARVPVAWRQEPTAVLVTNDNRRDRLAYYSGWAYTSGGILLDYNSFAALSTAAAAADVAELASAWSTDPVHRDAEVAFRLAPPTADERETPGGDEGDGVGEGAETAAAGRRWAALAPLVLAAGVVTALVAARRARR